MSDLLVLECIKEIMAKVTFSRTCKEVAHYYAIIIKLAAKA